MHFTRGSVIIVPTSIICVNRHIVSALVYHSRHSSASVYLIGFYKEKWMNGCYVWYFCEIWFPYVEGDLFRETCVTPLSYGRRSFYHFDSARTLSQISDSAPGTIDRYVLRTLSSAIALLFGFPTNSFTTKSLYFHIYTCEKDLHRNKSWKWIHSQKKTMVLCCWAIWRYKERRNHTAIKPYQSYKYTIPLHAFTISSPSSYITIIMAYHEPSKLLRVASGPAHHYSSSISQSIVVHSGSFAFGGVDMHTFKVLV